MAVELKFAPDGESLLYQDGELKTECCCGCLDCGCEHPEKIYVTVSWCGINTIELTRYRHELTTTETTSECYSWYQGSGVFGGGPGTAFFKVALLSQCQIGGGPGEPPRYTHDGKWCFDACSGSPTEDCIASDNYPTMQGIAGYSCPASGTGTDVPPSGCGTCMVAFELEFSP